MSINEIEEKVDRKHRMKIAMVGDYPQDKQKIGGGPQGVMVNIVESLSRASDEITIHVVSPQRDIKLNKYFILME